MLAALAVVFSWLWWAAVGILKLVIWLLGAVVFGIWWCQGYLLYMPTYPDRKGELRNLRHNQLGYREPSEQGLPFEDLYITAKDGCKVHCWLIPQEDRRKCPTVIFFHGNAGNIGYRIPNAKRLYEQVRCNVMMVDYRGYGNSEGHPSERGLNLDAQAVLDYCLSRPDLDPSKVFVYGQSLGGAVCISLAYRNQDKVAGVIVENTFTSIADMVVLFARQFGLRRGEAFLRGFLYFFLTNVWPSCELVRQLQVPILFMSGLDDELIPPEQMRRLHELATKSRLKMFHTVPKGMHNNTCFVGGPPYYETFSTFIARVISEREQ